MDDLSLTIEKTARKTLKIDTPAPPGLYQSRCQSMIAQVIMEGIPVIQVDGPLT